MSAAARSLRTSLRCGSRRPPTSPSPFIAPPSRQRPSAAPLVHSRWETTDAGSGSGLESTRKSTPKKPSVPRSARTLEALEDLYEHVSLSPADPDAAEGSEASSKEPHPRFEKLEINSKQVMMGPYRTSRPNHIHPDDWDRFSDIAFEDKATAPVRALLESSEEVLNDLSSKRIDEPSTARGGRSGRFWNADEEDSDLIGTENMEEDDDISSLAHAKLEEHREYRQYARLAAWQLPMLSKIAVPFQPPSLEQPLRFRYTSYMGELHPAESKVVVEFSPRDLGLNDAQQLKLKKLLGVRYDPEIDIAKMSCEQYEHQAQNKRYLSDVVNTLVAQAKDTTDTFEDVPLDTRHRKSKVAYKFPAEWRMTEERAQFLADTRQKALLLDEQKKEAGVLVDGTQRIAQFVSQPVPEAQPVMSGRGGARIGAPRGKAGGKGGARARA